MKTLPIHHENALSTASLAKTKLSKDINRILNRLHSSSRRVVKAALKEIRDLKNTFNKDLARSYEIDRAIRTRREELVIKRMKSGGHML